MHKRTKIAIPNSFKGKDLLFLIKDALVDGKNHKAKSILKKYYRFFNIECPNIIKDNKLTIGGSTPKLRRAHSPFKISVIITTYNEEFFIENALQSILNQTWVNIELIIVDDGSTDNTVSVLEKIASKDERVKYISLKQNVGVYSARNIALERVAGDFITFQDADDWSHPMRLEMQAKKLLQNDFLQATLSKFFRVNTETGLPFAIRAYPLHRLNPSSLMIRQNIIEEIGPFDHQTKAGGDNEYIDRIKKIYGVNSVRIIQEPLAIGAYRPKSLTSSGEAAILDNGKSEYREKYKIAYEKAHRQMIAQPTIKSHKLFNNACHHKGFFIGFSPWRAYIKSWFDFKEIFFIKKNIKTWQFFFIKIFIKLKVKKPIFLSWGYKSPKFIYEYANKNNIPFFYLEDGFLRSKKLGAEKSLPLSLTVDTQAPYFDTRKRTDLEDILNHYDFQSDQELMRRAENAIELLKELKISKYNQASECNVHELYGSKKSKRILVIGQVEDDASIRYGCNKPITNEELINIACNENPESQIIYKPHPDVWYGFRAQKSIISNLTDKCLILEKDIPLHKSFTTIDHVYTITSLAGFEALFYDIKVTTIGAPFYAGWGVTDTRQETSRRHRNLSKVEIFAASYILYPIYYNYTKSEYCQIEEVIHILT